MMRRDPQRRGVRTYNRSDAPRMRWTEELHARFVDAVRSLGGHDKATPKRILQLMGAKAVSISHIKSHLQMYRNMSNQITTAHPFLSTERVHTRKMLDPDDPNTTGSRVHSSANSSNGSFPWTSLEESSIESEPNALKFDTQFFKDNASFNQSQGSEMNLLRGSEIADEDISCKLTLSTYPYNHIYSGLEKTRKQEAIWQFHIDADMDAKRNKGSRGHPTHNHYFEGCINLELKISS
ncbi:hypothetical protein Taro_012146 [Colocasia esculenta]|uniref:HTH myb-type domain-containing protein n=1 Tax=Colocasia esculenta TaxID=4460 RepID=A0A843UCV4_COLES|nr:hypothetical protein [Colocasia esculenta]